jgi:hypothetical protein
MTSKEAEAKIELALKSIQDCKPLVQQVYGKRKPYAAISIMYKINECGIMLDEFNTLKQKGGKEYEDLLNDACKDPDFDELMSFPITLKKTLEDAAKLL